MCDKENKLENYSRAGKSIITFVVVVVVVGRFIVISLFISLIRLIHIDQRIMIVEKSKLRQQCVFEPQHLLAFTFIIDSAFVWI